MSHLKNVAFLINLLGGNSEMWARDSALATDCISYSAVLVHHMWVLFQHMQQT